MKFNFKNKEALLAGFKAGEKKSFKIIFDVLYSELIYYTTWSLLAKHGNYIVAAKDVVADVFYELFTKRELIKNLEHLVGFCVLACRNFTADHVRYDANKRNYVTGWSYLHDEPSDEQELNEKYNTEKILYWARQNIKGQTGLVFQMYYNLHCDKQTIVDVLKIKLQTVRNHCTMAVDIIRENISRIDGDFEAGKKRFLRRELKQNNTKSNKNVAGMARYHFK